MMPCRRHLLPLLVAALALPTADAGALVIYRFGGEQEPPPPEAGQPGVEFVQLPWESVDEEAGGSTFELDLSPEFVGALRRNPQINIAPTAEERGGVFVRPTVNLEVWDGDTSSVWHASRYLCAEIAEGNYFLTCHDDFGTEGTANIILGGQFQLDRIRVVSGLRDPARTVQAVRVYVATQMPNTSITYHPPPFLPFVVEIRDNREQILDIPMPPHGEVGFVQVTLGEHDTEWDVHDIEIFAKGFVKRSTYTSNIVDFGRPMAWGELRWAGSRGERAKVAIQTRSALDDTPLRYWRFTGRGTDREEVTPSEYDRLKLGEKAGTTYDQENWSFWGTYDFGDSLGVPIVSPSPRRYLQLQADFLPQEDDGGEIRFLEFRASVPVATSLVGEVWPVVARLGQPTDFTYALRPTIGSSDAGFDRLEIRSASLLGALRNLRIGDADVPFTPELQEPHRMVVSFPKLRSGDSGSLIEVDFEAEILRYGAGFDVRVFDSEQPLEVPQSVNPGDASREFEGNTNSVATSDTDEGELLQVRVPQPVLTPNGDGINDAATLQYTIFEITGTAAVRVEIWDLAGRRVRLLHSADEGVGSYTRTWDGRGDDDQLLPPGIYPYTVDVDTDLDDLRKAGILHVAY